MSIKTLNPKDVVTNISGVNINGFADGTFVNVERTNDNYSDISGADGFVTRVKSNDLTGTITITLVQSSSSNSFLSTLLQADELTADGIFPITIKDFNGLTLILSPYSWILKPPVVTYGKELNNYEWMFRSSNLNIFVGGVE